MSTVGQALGGIVGGVVGFLTGGPTGALYGAQIGMMAGGYLDPPKGPTMRGPRLNDLSVQTSTYGASLPRIRGKMGTFGNIFWLENNKLKEVVRKTEQGGKGGGSTTTIKTYEYYATYAVSLCDTTVTGPMAGVQRIWVGGQLFYNAGSSDRQTIQASNQASAKFRFYSGSETQLPDPRMQADVGATDCPAYRGVCYIVFYDLPLATYGNTLMGAQVKVELVDSNEQELSVTVVDLINPLGDSAVTGDNTPLAMVANFSGTNPGAHFLNKYSLSVSTINTRPYLSGNTFYDRYTRQFLAFREFPGIGYGWDIFDGETGAIRGTVLDDDKQPDDQIVHRIGAGIIVFLTTTGFNVYVYAIDSKGFSYSIPSAGALSIGSTVYPQSFYLDEALIVRGKIGIYAARISSYETLYEYAGGDSTFQLTGAVTDGSVLYVSVTESSGTVTRMCEVDGGVLTTMFSLPGGTHVCDYDTSSGRFVTNRSVYNRDGSIHFTFQQETYLGDPAPAIALDGMVLFPVYSSLNQPMKLVGPYYDAGAADLRQIVESECLQSKMLTLSDIDASELDQEVRGYRVSTSGAIRAALEPLQGAWPFDVVQRGYKLHFVPRGNSSVVTIDASELNARPESEAPGTQLAISNEMDTLLPRRVNIRYIDTLREYDIAEQSQDRDAVEIANLVDMELPIVLNANEAAGMAEVLLYLYWLERRDVSFVLPPSRRALEPADVITITGEWGTYELRLTQVSLLSDGRVECAAKFNAAALYDPNAQGEEGSVIPPDTLAPAGPSVYILLDIPLLLDGNNVPGWPAAMSGYSDAWPGGIIYRSSDAGQSWATLQAFSGPVTMGFAIGTMGTGRVDIVDSTNTLQVNLLSGELSSITELAQLNGGNVFAYGRPGRWEICSARNCVLQADGSYILSDWLRGRFGSEWAMTTHEASDFIVLMTDTDIAFIGMPGALIGVEQLYNGVTSGAAISSGTQDVATYSAVNLTPLSGVYPAANRATNDDWTITWIRRGRVSPEWRNLVDVPVGEASEAYEIDIFSDSAYATVERTLTATTPSVTYTSAQQVENFGSVQNVIYAKIYQMSETVGRGYPLTVEFESSAAWTPAELPVMPGLWINDTSPVTLVSGAVSQVDDISGNGRNFSQATAGNRPALNTFNGFRTIDFDGTNDRLERTNDSLFNNVPAAWTFVIYRTDVTDGSAIDRPVFAASVNVDTTSRVFFAAGNPGVANQPLYGGRQIDGSAFSGLGSATARPEQWTMVLGVNTYTARTIDLHTNGDVPESLSSQFTSAANTSATDSALVRIGSHIGASPTAHFNGQIAEILAGNTVLDPDDIDRLFGYAAWKFGLVSSLPSGHPYKHERPLV